MPNSSDGPESGPVGHGEVGVRAQPFTSILDPLGTPPHKPKDLATLAALMKGDPDTVKDGPDPEENLWVPAGYTYFGQFIDHDLTFDSTSSLNKSDTDAEIASRIPTNLRTPRFDLDCVYGDGPDAQPFMYADDGATLLLGSAGGSWNGMPTADHELLRSTNGRAIIGDKRNDENSIVNQIQQGFIKFHNAVVANLKMHDPKHWNVRNDLFKSAQNEVRWTYQRLVLEDFLPRIVRHEVFADLVGKTRLDREELYAFYTKEKRKNLPLEFVGAAYRFGHSGVRTGYRLNRVKRLSIFPGTLQDSSDDSLIGFDPLPASHVIDDWGRFFPNYGPRLPQPGEDRSKAAGDLPINPDVRLQFAYKLDPTIVDPLGVLPLVVAGKGTRDEAEKELHHTLPDHNRPSLALLNLLRGNRYLIHGGQDYFALLAAKFPATQPLDPKYLVVRMPAKRPKSAPNDSNWFKFEPIAKVLQDQTPLWFYILAEAQVPVVDAIKPTDMTDGAFREELLLTGGGAETQLGWVGGRMVAEVFYGLMDSDPDSITGGDEERHSHLRIKHLKDLLEFKPH